MAVGKKCRPFSGGAARWQLADSDFRPCILAVFSDANGRVLVAERTQPHPSWQFPQGGIDPGETAAEALRREMREEIGCDDFTVLGQSPEPIRYTFPPGMTAPIAKQFRGQDQVWFHVRFAAGAGPDLAKATDREFSATAWVTPTEAVERVVVFKKDAYKLGLAALGIPFDPVSASSRER